MMMDMLLYGVPMEFDTGSNESHHKPSKYAAKLTQRNEATFNFQTAMRLTEFLILDMAMAELDGTKVWEYFERAVDIIDAKLAGPEKLPLVPDDDDVDVDELVSGFDDLIVAEDYDLEVSDDNSVTAHEESMAPDMETDGELVVTTRGTRIEIFRDPDDDDAPSFKVLGRSKSAKNTSWVVEIIDFLARLQDETAAFLPDRKLRILTEQQRGGVTFRGHPNFQGRGFWRDWAVVDWGAGYGKIPAHIWCFVELPAMPTGGSTIKFGGITLKKGVYAVVESAAYDAVEDTTKISDLFTPMTLEVEALDADDHVTRRFFLADTDAIVGPCIVIPDIGGPPNAYFQVKNRSQWKDEFVYWLRQPHKHDVIEFPDGFFDESVHKKARKQRKQN